MKLNAATRLLATVEAEVKEETVEAEYMEADETAQPAMKVTPVADAVARLKATVDKGTQVS